VDKHISDSLFSALFESTGDPIWAVNLEHRLTAFNNSFQHTLVANFGLLPKLGMAPMELWPQTGISPFAAYYERAFSSGSFSVEYPLLNGTTFEIFFTPMVSEGVVSGISAFGRDITARKQAAQGFIEKERIFHQFFEANSAVILLIEPVGGVIVDANPAAVAFYGYSHQQLLAMNIRQINTLPPEETHANWEQALRKHKSTFFFTHRLASGQVRSVEVHASPVTIAGVPMLFSVIYDMSERDRAIQQLADLANQFQQFFLANSSVVLLLDPSNGVIVDANRAATEYFGYSRKQMTGMELSRINPRSHEVILADLERAAQKESNHLFLQQRLASGEVRDVEVHSSLVAMNDKPMLFSILHDITERNRVTTELAASEAQFRRFFEENSTVMLLVDPTSREIVQANKAAAAFYGYSPEQLVGKPIGEINGLDLLETQRDARLIVDAKVNTFPRRHRLASGEVRDVVAHTTSILLDGRPMILSIIHDETERQQAERALHDSEERYRATFEQASVGILHTGFDGAFLRCNQRLADMVGYSVEEVTALSIQQLTHPDDLSTSMDLLPRTKAAPVTMEKRYIRKDGSITWVRLSSSLQSDSEGRPLHLITLVQDINELKAAQQRLDVSMKALEASEARYRAAFQTSETRYRAAFNMNLDPTGISRLDNGTFVEVNPAFLQLFGYTLEETIGHTSLELQIFFDPGARERLADLLRSGSPVRDYDLRLRKKCGEIFPALISASAIELDGVPMILLSARDVSAVRAAEVTIRDLAFYDSLTRLPNRRLFLERLEHSLLSGRGGMQKALLLVDLDNFTVLNDTMGHGMGDLVLKETATRLAACAQPADTLARIGGDEFAIILEDLSKDALEAAAQARVFADKILAAMSNRSWFEGYEWSGTASIGVSVYGHGGDNVFEILKQAEIAGQEAKLHGRNAVHYYAPALHAAVQARVDLEKELQHAIERNEFQLYYQPQVMGRKVIGVESLIRWNHPTRGIVMPGEFISLSEQTGQILPMSAWGLQTACAQLAAWAGRKDRSEIAIAANISALHMRQPDFVSQVMDILNRTGANPKSLRLELTESMLVDNIEDTIAKMNQLRSYGVRFALDDFGTGYSSLVYLKRLPLDRLKIDRGFVKDIPEDEASGAIASTIVSLGTALGMSVIAEGVETEEQRCFLARLGCHRFQGYLFSRPLPIDKLELFIENFGKAPVPISEMAS